MSNKHKNTSEVSNSDEPCVCANGSKDVDTIHKDCPVCPYCGYSAWECDFGTVMDIDMFECVRCGKKFSCAREVEVSHSISKKCIVPKCKAPLAQEKAPQLCDSIAPEPMHCPDCGNSEFEFGASGGGSQNVHCLKCGSWWNEMGPFGFQRIDQKGEEGT